MFRLYETYRRCAIKALSVFHKCGGLSFKLVGETDCPSRHVTNVTFFQYCPPLTNPFGSLSAAVVTGGHKMALSVEGSQSLPCNYRLILFRCHICHGCSFRVITHSFQCSTEYYMFENRPSWILHTGSLTSWFRSSLQWSHVRRKISIKLKNLKLLYISL